MRRGNNSEIAELIEIIRRRLAKEKPSNDEVEEIVSIEEDEEDYIDMWEEG